MMRGIFADELRVGDTTTAGRKDGSHIIDDILPGDTEGELRLGFRGTITHVRTNPGMIVGLLNRPYPPGETERSMRRKFWRTMMVLNEILVTTNDGKDAEPKQLGEAETAMEEAWDAYRLGKPAVAAATDRKSYEDVFDSRGHNRCLGAED